MPFTPKRMGSVAYSLVMFVVVSVLAGVLIAGLFVPFVGLAGVTSSAAATELSSLPAELATPAPATRSRVVMGNGKTLAYFYDENRIPVKLSQVAPIMRQAQVAIEDHRFYQHGALDLKGTLRALVRNSTSDGNVQGGSSITQQYVKMVQIEACQTRDNYEQCVKDAQAPTVDRKVRELRYAIAIEKRLTKDQILERYLNIAYYGQHSYGIEAAAKHYFSTSASQLTLPQAAMLAGLVQNPDSNNPERNLPAAMDRRDVVLNRMAELGLITIDQARAAKKVGFNKKLIKPTPNGCVDTDFPFLCDYVKATLLQSPSLGDNRDERENMLNRGGLTIYTAIDPKMQRIAQKAVSKTVSPKDPLIATMNMVQPGTGLILAMAQNRYVMGSNTKKGETYFNYSVPYAMGGAEGYQAGSTFKAFTAAAALEKGIPLSKKYNAPRKIDLSNVHFSTCFGDAWDPKYRPSNSTAASGNMDMYRGMAMSVNTYFLQLEKTVGVCAASKMADRLGVEKSIPNGTNLSEDRNLQVPSFTLGVANVAPISMAEAYATFASRGIHCNPVIVSKIVTRSGKTLDVPDANCKRVLSKGVADGMARLLSRVMQSGGTGSGIRIPGIRYQAGKTGTTEDNQAVWFNGFTREVAGVAMISVENHNKYWKTHRKSIKGFYVKSTQRYLQGHGSTDAGRFIWLPAMTQAMKGKPDLAFHTPPDSILHGKRVQVPSIYGLSPAAAKAKLEKAGFSVLRQDVYSNAPKGTFLGYRPGSYAWIEQYGTIYATFSKGKDPKVVAAEKKKAADAKKKADQKNKNPGGKKKPGGGPPPPR